MTPLWDRPTIKTFDIQAREAEEKFIEALHDTSVGWTTIDTGLSQRGQAQIIEDEGAANLFQGEAAEDTEA